MDQPAPEILRLEKVLDAYVRWEELESKKSSTRNKNRQRHQSTRIGVEE